jgi:hypothetical protein
MYLKSLTNITQCAFTTLSVAEQKGTAWWIRIGYGYGDHDDGTILYIEPASVRI